jgi:ACS family D-galactonate transporter-like MFS transporter
MANGRSTLTPTVSILMLVSINYIDRTSLSVAMPLISKDCDLDPAMGRILISFFWTYAFMQVPGGVLADRYKPRIVIALATVGWASSRRWRRFRRIR